jgi:hypothetical protein
MLVRGLVIPALVLAICSALAAEDGFAPFVIPAAPNDRSLAALPSPSPIQTDGPRVVVRDGRFYLGDKRFKVWGVNTTFAASFPTHADAEALATRLAAAGVNSVRFHHMDMSGFPNGIWDPKDPKKLSAEALDRLDYLLDQLARRGIFANLNLHVSRTHSKVLGLPDGGHSFDKIIDLFTPEIIEAQKAYARDLLTHVNAYRKVRYADDPAVAFVEISNEDSLFMWGFDGTLRGLPDRYAQLLKDRFNAWLKSRYGSSDKLRAVWDKDASPLGEEMLLDGRFADVGEPARNRWTLEVHADNTAKLVKSPDPAGGGRVEISKANQTNWHIQLHQANLVLKAGQYYTVQFKARADQPRGIDYYTGQAHDPWAHLGLNGSARLTKEWKTFRVGFVASADEPNARVSFTLGNSTVAAELADVSLRPGGREGLGKDESIEAGNVALFPTGETPARSLDRLRFLAELEKGFWDSMRGFVRNDLGCKALVTGTIVYGPLGMYGQSDMDFVDSHSYWQHPHFPGRPWDAENWLIPQKTMVDSPSGATLPRIASERLSGKPFTVSEYCHPAPNDYQAECIPEFAAYAAAQDWDGVWFFDYGSVPNAGKIGGFFSYGDNPSKWGFMAVGAGVFRFGGIAPLTNEKTVALAKSDDPLADLAGLHQRRDLNILAAAGDLEKLTWKDLLETRLYASIKPGASAPADRAGAGGRLDWSVSDKRKGVFHAAGPGAIVWVGWANPRTSATTVTLTSPSFAAIVMAPLDGEPFARTKKVLVAACGRCENTDMKFTPDRQSVGRNWGKPPVMIEAVDGAISFPDLAKGAWKVQPLGPDGLPMGEAGTVQVEPGKRLLLESKNKTMWYLLTRP